MAILALIRGGGGGVAQSVTCLTADECMTAVPEIVSLIKARPHILLEIGHEIISMAILSSTDSFKKGCCQLQAKVCARSTGYPPVQACPCGKKCG